MNNYVITANDLNLTYDLSNANYEIDALQNELLQFYLRADSRFRMAFSRNYTPQLIQYFKDKARLKEPCHLDIMGVVRSGKSSIASSLCFLHQIMYKKTFWVDYICANEIEFLQKLQEMPEEQTKNTIFQIDEEKSYFGIGSTAKKMKIQDVQNIIAKHNISTISLCPTKFSNPDAYYGLRVWGKDFKSKTCRCMLYNLQDRSQGKSLPMGCVYLPIPSILLKNKEIAEEFDKEYQSKKDEWIKDEMAGKGDVLGDLKRKTAITFLHDKKYMNLKRKSEKLTYISIRLGTEWSVGEKKEILEITELLRQGIEL